MAIDFDHSVYVGKVYVKRELCFAILYDDGNSATFRSFALCNQFSNIYIFKQPKHSCRETSGSQSGGQDTHEPGVMGSFPKNRILKMIRPSEL